MANPGKQGKHDIPRDEKGRFPKGVSGNPDGRAKGAPSLVAELRRQLKDDEGATMASIVQKLIALAKKGDLRAIEAVGDRLDGKPTQTTRIEGPPVVLDWGFGHDEDAATASGTANGRNGSDAVSGGGVRSEVRQNGTGRG